MLNEYLKGPTLGSKESGFYTGLVQGGPVFKFVKTIFKSERYALSLLATMNLITGFQTYMRAQHQDPASCKELLKNLTVLYGTAVTTALLTESLEAINAPWWLAAPLLAGGKLSYDAYQNGSAITMYNNLHSWWNRSSLERPQQILPDEVQTLIQQHKAMQPPG